jgi:TatD DNase family protein
LGGYFSISGYFAQERKAKQQEVFRHVPSERLLIETDAPDMLPPEEYVEFPLRNDSREKPLNNPANIGAVYRFVAKLRNESIEVLAKRTEENFLRLYGGLIR